MRVLLLCIALAAWVDVASADLYHSTAMRYRLDPVLLQSIAKVESGGRPWTLNIDGEPATFKTKRALIDYYGTIQGSRYVVKTKRRGRWTYEWFADKHAAGTALVRARRLDAAARVAPADRAVMRAIDPRNTDVGVMQVNWRIHGHLTGLPLEDFVEPAHNMDYAARFLATLIRRHGIWEGIGRYHSPTSARKRGYQERIWSAYTGLKDYYARVAGAETMR